MNVLLLKEPNDGDQGSDPYNQVEARKQYQYKPSLFCHILMLVYFCHTSGNDERWPASDSSACAIF